MRHRARRPFIDLFRRASGAAARPFAALTRVNPVRLALAAALVLGLGTTAVVATSAVYDGTSGDHARTAALGDRPARTTSRGTDRPRLESQSPSPDGRKPRRQGAGSATPTPDRPKDEQSASSEPVTEAGPTTALPSTDQATGSTSGSDGGGATQAPSPTRRTTASSPSPRDTTAPNTSVSRQETAGDTSQFTFSADEPASFTCSLDGAGWTSCSSPETYSDLSPGWHTFAVRATDRVGNVDPTPAQVRWHAHAGGSAGQ